MISVIAINKDFLDVINKHESGNVSTDMFNRILWRAQLSVIDWLTGSPTSLNPPAKIATQKTQDWLSTFTVKKPVQVYNGIITEPVDYYTFRSLYRLNGKPATCVDEIEEDELEVIKVPIELLDEGKFSMRCSTNIKRLKPINKNIAKRAGNEFEFEPRDIGSVVLEYYRLPIKATLVQTIDQTYNQEVPDTVNSIDLEWNEGAREPLVWFMVDIFTNQTRDQTLKQFNAASKQP